MTGRTFHFCRYRVGSKGLFAPRHIIFSEENTMRSSVRIAAVLGLSFVALALSASDIIETLAGGGSLDGYKPSQADLALGSSQGLAVSALGEVYFSDSAHNQVLKVVPTTGRITVVAGNGTQTFSGDGL